MKTLTIPFLLGVVNFTILAFQWAIASQGRWLLAFPISLLLGYFTYIKMHYAMNDTPMFCSFTVGAAFGTSLGMWAGAA